MLLSRSSWLVPALVWTWHGCVGARINARQIPKVREVTPQVVRSEPVACQAGYGLPCGPADLRWKERGITSLLSLVPCLTETLTVALVAFLAGKLSFTWGLMLGFLLADVSPAVTVPLLMELIEKGFGRRHTKPSLDPDAHLAARTPVVCTSRGSRLGSFPELPP